MNCPNCNTINDNEYVFCVNCGTAVTQTISGQANVLPDTQAFNSQQFSSQNYDPSQSTETKVVPLNPFQPSMSGFNPSIPHTGGHQTAKSGKIFVWIGTAVFLILLAAGGGIYFLSRQNVKAETLPAHLGIFIQNKEKDRVDEIKKLDFTNALDGKENLLKDETLPALEESPNWILYSDNKDVSLSDLRLIQLDTVKEDGSLKQLDFQAAPVEGKPEMKRIRVADGLANGKYAFALLDGFLDDGKHKFWAFQIKNAQKSDNGSALKSTTIALKPKSTSKETLTTKNPTQPTNPNNPPPPPAPPPSGTLRVASATTSDLVLRSGPGQSYGKIGELRRGQKAYVMSYSDNYEVFKTHYANFAYIQTESGKRGWVYTAFLK